MFQCIFPENLGLISPEFFELFTLDQATERTFILRCETVTMTIQTRLPV